MLYACAQADEAGHAEEDGRQEIFTGIRPLVQRAAIGRLPESYEWGCLLGGAFHGMAFLSRYGNVLNGSEYASTRCGTGMI